MRETPPQLDIPVVICGGGPVGLAMAIELAKADVQSLVIERHPGTAVHPKARNINSRSMEIIRGWDAQTVAAMHALDLDPKWKEQIVYTRSLGGEEFGRMRTVGFSGAGLSVSPETPVLTSQDLFEPVFLETVRRSGRSDVRFSQRVTGFEVDGESVRVHIEGSRHPDGEVAQYTLTCRYLIAADGADSGIRRQLGIPVSGRTAIGHYVNVHYTADLRRWTDDRRAVMFWVADDQARGVFQPLDGRGRWLCQIAYDGKPETFAEWTADHCRAWIRRMVKDPALAIDVHAIGSWTMNATVADRFSRGPVFLVGDAAQQMPPTGGFGVNTGLQGVHNLAWKLAAVLKGHAGSRLLDSYETERRPIAIRNTERSLINSRVVMGVASAGQGTHPDGLTPAQAVALTREYGNFLGMEFGPTYDGEFITADGVELAAIANPVSDYLPSAAPGHRLPHAVVVSDGDSQSTIDLVERSIVLLCFEDHGWKDAISGLRATYPIRQVNVAYDDHLGALFDIEPDGAVLVRPDGYVAARWAKLPENPGRAISEALARVLGRSLPGE